MIEPKLIETDSGPLNGRWFIDDGLRRRHVTSKRSLQGTLFENCAPEKVTPEYLESLAPTSPVGVVSLRRPSRFLRSSLDMREAFTGRLSGLGVEFGAGGSPLPVPYAANVLFSDFYDKDGLIENIYEGQMTSEILAPDFQIGLEDADKIPVENLDFIIACHVIEHVANPVKAILNCLGKLKIGGKLVLVVPDKRKTFDKKRKLTTVRHLMDDYLKPSKNEDFKHFVDFYEKAQPPEDPQLILPLAQEKFSENFPIHYHTFTHRSFRRLLKTIQRRQTSVHFTFWSRGTRFTKADIEFYLCLERSA